MTSRAWVLAALVLIGCCDGQEPHSAPAADERITIEYDRFNKATKIAADDTEVGPFWVGARKERWAVRSGKLKAWFLCSGNRDSCGPASIELMLIDQTRTWSFQQPRVVKFLLDGSRPSTEIPYTWDGQVLGGYDLVEYVQFSIRPDLLLQLTKSATVDVRVGVYEFQLNSENIASLKALASRLSAPKRSTTR